MEQANLVGGRGPAGGGTTPARAGLATGCDGGQASSQHPVLHPGLRLGLSEMVQHWQLGQAPCAMRWWQEHPPLKPALGGKLHLLESCDA